MLAFRCHLVRMHVPLSVPFSATQHALPKMTTRSDPSGLKANGSLIGSLLRLLTEHLGAWLKVEVTCGGKMILAGSIDLARHLA